MVVTFAALTLLAPPAPATDTTDPTDPTAVAALELPETRATYRIEARLSAERREVSAEQWITWQSPASQPLTTIRLHLYLNAFSHTATTWVDGRSHTFGLELADHAETHGDPWGYVKVEQIRQRLGDRTEPCPLAFVQPDDGNPIDRTLAEVTLAEPLAPGARLELELTFLSRLPVPIARTGGKVDYFHVAQWFPKLGVYEPPGARRGEGWAARQFHGTTEFYADFATYDVTLETPAGFTVVATGEGREVTGAPDGWQRQRFVQGAVHDFAWVAGRDLYAETHPFTPRGGGERITITYVTPVGTEGQVARMRMAAEATFDLLGARVGPYPFSTMTIVQPTWRGRRTAGMEYPTLVTGLPGDPLFDLPGFADMRWLEGTVIHEVIHNYFQGVVANDEQSDAFLDEGITSYWTERVVEQIAAGRQWGATFGYPVNRVAFNRQSLASTAADVSEAIRRRPSFLFYPGTRRAQIYVRPSLLLLTATNLFGAEAVDRLFAAYYARFRFRHPTADDFQALADELGPPELAAFLREGLSATAVPDYRIVEATSEPWQSPLGYVPGAERPVDEGSRAAASEARVGLDPAARELDGRVTVEITDPGFYAADGERPGSVERRAVVPEEALAGADGALAAQAERDAEPTHFRTTVRLRGPAWRHLPVDLIFRFADGAVVRDRWDGRAAWRQYRFLRPAALREVRIDPDDRLLVDAWPENNGRRLPPDRGLGNDFGRWLALVSQWLALGVASWL